MKYNIHKKLILKLLCLAILLFATFEFTNSPANAAPRLCPPESAFGCERVDTLYYFDENTCTCACPLNSPACAGPGGVGMVNQESCTCQNTNVGGCSNYGNPEYAFCMMNNGSWDSASCYCSYAK